MKNKKNSNFNNFVDFGMHIQKTKEENIKNAFERLSKGVFVETLDHLTHVQIHNMMPPDKFHYTDYVFDNKKDIVFKNCELESHIYRNVFTVIYSIYINHTNETIKLLKPFHITDKGFNNGFELETFGDIYLKKEFVEKYKSNNYTQQEFLLIQLYKKIFNDDSTTDMNPHMIKKNNLIIINDDFKYITEYELYSRKKIHAGVSKSLKFESKTAFKIDKERDFRFIERLTSLLESGYTLPLLDKKIDELTEDDITLIKMSII